MASSDWTAGRLRTFITSTLRGGFRKYPAKYECLQKAFVGKKINIKSNRLSAHYLCNHCKGEFPTADVQVDHVNPIVNPDDGFVSWDEYIKNLFCPIENLQVLCTTCHDAKTLGENKLRKDVRDANKKNKA